MEINKISAGSRLTKASCHIPSSLSKAHRRMPRVSGQCALTCPTYRPVLLIIYIGASTIGLYFKNVSNPVYFLLAIRRGSLQKTTALPLIYALAIKKGCAEMH